ncbi:signal peptidase I [Gilvimarinus algae]|uniref:Signal peptidase I n=1 Tax=Gilvimarinus algae TaxID=3058037 RepID=A0ABT8TC45_9GAMM|nr:signal peptidase I [Gilvimarinus sp. SDUM040014]MDO3381665.1 signal peptidase I [Gilvimarinus sp. SDUM040014]
MAEPTLAQPRRSLRRLVRQNAGFILLVLGLAFFRTAVADWNYVPSSSMEPTLYPGDVLVINKLAYGPSVPFTRTRLVDIAQPERGDVITFFPSHTDNCLVKRVIGVPGDRLRIRGERVWLNDEELRVSEKDGFYWEALPGSSHKIADPAGELQPAFAGELIVPDGHYFVMGDNRANSYDSRYWGLVKESQIVGKVAAVGLNVSERFFQRWATQVL